MLRPMMTFFLNIFFIDLVLISKISSLHLQSQTTEVPHKHVFTTPPPVVAGGTTSVTKTVSKDGIALYRLLSKSTGTTCILLKTDGVVEINFKLHDLEEQADTFIPEKAIVEGSCKNEDRAYLKVSWSGYTLFISFSKSPGGELWYIDKVELSVKTDIPQLKGIKTHATYLKLYHTSNLIPTPVGKSYACEELDIDLLPDNKNQNPPGLKGSLLLRALQVQPFMYKSENFEEAIECRNMKMFRDETAPIAVGSTLALCVLLTIGGYALFRYFRIKNVQYNAME